MEKKPKKKKIRSSAVPTYVSTTNKGANKKKISYFPWLPVLLGITAVCFFPMMKNGFTNWDDELYVVKNTMLRGPDWHAIFTQPVAANYHPLTIISFVFNYGISGTEPWSYLLINFLLHLINGVLVFKFIYTIS